MQLQQCTFLYQTKKRGGLHCFAVLSQIAHGHCSCADFNNVLSFVAGGAFVYISVCSSHYHKDLGQAHQVGIVNASCSGEYEETQQSLMQCLHTIEVINSTVSHVGKSKAHLLQLKSDIQNEIASLHLKDASLIPHSRRRPPVDTWNT